MGLNARVVCRDVPGLKRNAVLYPNFTEGTFLSASSVIVALILEQCFLQPFRTLNSITGWKKTIVFSV